MALARTAAPGRVSRSRPSIRECTSAQSLKVARPERIAKVRIVMALDVATAKVEGASSPIESQNHRHGASSLCHRHVAEALVQSQSGVVALHTEAQLRDAKSARLLVQTR